MARMNCICGTVLSNSIVPNDIELIVYTEKEWEQILQHDTIETWRIPLPNFDVWKCPRCERIYVFKQGDNKPIKIYMVESR